MRAVIYSNGNQECQRMTHLLESLGEEFHQYELDKDFTTSQFSAEFGSDAEFPQVAIGYKHIGSIKETLQYLKTKEVL
tara:strand:- start:11 stop:244 length:234 start_codon:yes stop_codon:yes gene_type:complete